MVQHGSEKKDECSAHLNISAKQVTDADAVVLTNPVYDDEAPGRILSNEEYADQLRKHADIFIVEKDTHLRNLELVCLLLALFSGIYLSTHEIVDVATDFFESRSIEREVKLVEAQPVTQQKEMENEKSDEFKTEVRKLKPNKHAGAGGKSSGGGDPHQRVTKKGVLGILSGHIKGKTIATTDIFAKGGFASGIDPILLGLGGLKTGSSGVGRKGVAGIGYNAGLGSGTGGGTRGIDDLIGGLMDAETSSLTLRKRRGSLKIAALKPHQGGGPMVGGRSRASIMRVVMQNLAALRYAYNKRLREKPGLKGRITVKFAIDEFGEVIFCSIVSSTMSDPLLEKTVSSKIKRWAFEKIDKPGDVTEVVYPFVFSQ